MFVDLDVHKKYTEVAILDEDGAIRKQERIENKLELIEEISNRLSSGCGYGILFYLVIGFIK